MQNATSNFGFKVLLKDDAVGQPLTSTYLITVILQGQSELDAQFWTN